MSALLLDTHIWLWYAEGDGGRLRPASVRKLDDARKSEGLGVSAISVWEIGMHAARGRIQLAVPLRDWVERALGFPGIRLAPLDAAVATAYGWVDYTPDMAEEEILRRLLVLNLTLSPPTHQ